MIPNAETLRKIQVEHGVTGSFKDRPLADWLQKHNPGEDEYEKVGDCGFMAPPPPDPHAHRLASSALLKDVLFVDRCFSVARDGSDDGCKLTASFGIGQISF